jgi:DNA-binding Lrp family transcriptional regulator
MNAKEKIIVSLLRENSRISLTEMSKFTSIPISTLFERLREYNHGLIKKHTTLIDFSVMGYEARARVLYKAKRGETNKLKDLLNCCRNVNELYKVNNGFDFMVEFIFKNMKEMEEHLLKISEMYPVEKEQVFYMVEEIKKEEFLSKPMLEKMKEVKV